MLARWTNQLSKSSGAINKQLRPIDALTRHFSKGDDHNSDVTKSNKKSAKHEENSDKTSAYQMIQEPKKVGISYEEYAAKK